MKHRDIVTVDLPDKSVMATACDVCASIGNKPGDALAAPLEIVGALTARTPLLELLSMGIEPCSGSVTIAGEPEPTASKLLAGVRRELGGDIQLALSTEKNMPTCMTALGVSLTGIGTLRPVGGFQTGDEIWIVGVPSVGEDVLRNAKLILTADVMRRLSASTHVREVLPVGSRGIEAELHDMLASAQSSVEWLAHTVDLRMSAGPSTVAIVVCEPGQIPDVSIPVLQLGWVVRLR